MRFIGVDLAWGSRNGTGLCVLDPTGAVLGSTRVRDDEEILEWIRPHLDRGDALIGVDAPLVVNNPAGRRRCEALVGAAFGHREAGAYPANRGQPHFSDGGRAARLANALGLSVEPRLAPGEPLRSMIEVYPHTALVCLFELPVTLKYKRRAGRAHAVRIAAFAQLVTLLESLESSEPPLRLRRSTHWARVRRAIAEAPTLVALDRAEDELDAYICAYIALHYFTHGEQRCAVIGDVREGYIVTPIDADARLRLG